MSRTKDTWNIAIAIFCGMVIGAYAMNEFAQSNWWLGLPLGGFVAYLACEPMKVVRAIPQAWVAAGGLMPGRHICMIIFWVFLGGVAAIIQLLGLVAVFLSWTGDSLVLNKSTLIVAIFAGMTYSYILAAVSNINALGKINLSVKKGKIDTRKKISRHQLKINRLLACRFAVRSFPFIWPILLGKFAFSKLGAIARAFVILFRSIGSFLFHLFVLIHSQKRTICMVDCMFGLAILHYWLPFWASAAIGIALGLVNHHLVTMKFLVPKGYLPPREAETTA